MRKQRVCLLTLDLAGPIRNGGIGTAFGALAERLQEEGHEVTILYPCAFTETDPITQWQEWWGAKGIRLETCFCEPHEKYAAYEAWAWLRDAPRFDVIHFHEWRGVGYWLTVAKRCGLGFADTTLVCQAHGNSWWHQSHSGAFLHDLHQLEVGWLERRSVEGADVLYAPSHYMLREMEAQAWTLPERRFVTPNLLPPGFAAGPPPAEPGGREWVFFGRLESRKGLALFCDAVGRAVAGGAAPERVTFLGKVGEMEGEPALGWIARAAADWPMPWSVRNDLGPEGARDYLRGPGRLAVIASASENSPYTVLECLAAGIPFLAADVGGTAELVAEADRPRILFQRDAPSLAAALFRCRRDGQLAAEPAVPLAENRRRWMEWHASLPIAAPRLAAEPRDAVPLVSVCIGTFNRSETLARAIASVETQTYPRIELVVTDDASTAPEALAFLDALEPRLRARGGRLRRNPRNLFAGASRNGAVAEARGDYVLLMDDDNVAFPDEVEVLVRAALASGADFVTCQQQPFSGPGAPPAARARRPVGFMPIGPNIAQAVHENCLGDANMLCRRGAYLELGGMTEERTGFEDWEFLLRAALKGYRLECLPHILFRYRIWTGGRTLGFDHESLVRSHRRVLASALAEAPPELRAALRLGVETRLEHLVRSRLGDWGRMRASDWERAEHAGLAPNSAEAFVAAARTAQGNGQPAAARALAEQALLLSPGHTAARSLLATLE